MKIIKSVLQYIFWITVSLFLGIICTIGIVLLHEYRETLNQF